MADKDLTRGIKIYLDTTKYSQGMKQLSQATREYEFTLKGLREAGKGNTEQAKRLEAQIAQNKKIYQQYSAELDRQKKILENLDKATYPELVAMQKKLRAQVQSSKRDTTEYTVALQQLTRVNLEVAEAQKRDAPPERKAARKLFIPYQDEIRGSRFFRRYRCQCRLLLCKQYLGGQVLDVRRYQTGGKRRRCQARF
ncbi:hypothetical protein NXV60_16640 [Bacteroides fragilis]|nr:hypothetical protein NXV60_16640 [Bacteroides fragilis]